MKISILNSRIVTISAGIIIIIGFFILSFFSVKAESVRWKGYRVLVLSLPSSEKDILQRLSEQGITDYISESNTKIVNISPEAPLQPSLTEINSKQQEKIKRSDPTPHLNPIVVDTDDTRAE